MNGLLRPARVVALGGLLLALVCHVASYVPLDPHLFQPLVFGSFPVMFPLVLIVVLAQNQRRVKIDDLIRYLTLPERLLFGALLAYVVMDFFLMVSALPGQPEVHGDRFFMNSHGALTRISQADYSNALRHTVRLFSGHEIVFHAVVLGLATMILRRDLALSSGAVQPSRPPAEAE